MNEYPLGKTIRFRQRYEDPLTGLPYDPTTVTVKFRKPSSTTAEAAATKIEDGLYEVLYLPDSVGDWAGKWVAVGVINDTSLDFAFRVLRSAIP